jgi:hypothetical protein
VFEKGIARKLDFSFSGTQSLRISQLLEDGLLEIGGIEVTFAVGFVAGDQRDVRRQIDVQAGVEFDIGMNGADFQQPIFQQLRNAQALGCRLTSR